MVHIITDSAADFEPAELAELHITCIPLKVMFGDAEYEENINLSKEQFYSMLAACEAPPKTSQPAPQYLMDLFAQAQERQEETIYISLASALSGAYQSAVVLRNMLDYDGCYVFDSQNATGGQRILVEYAVRLRDAGKSAPEILEALKEVRDRIVLYACVDTLEYLYKGGRISQTVYKLGTMANIKPIICVEQSGAISVPAKAIGTRKGMDILRKQLQNPAPDFPVYSMYTSNIATGQALAQKLGSVDESHIIQVGAAIGSHVGPNACGVVYVSANI